MAIDAPLSATAGMAWALKVKMLTGMAQGARECK